jgi:hypothetical protein
MDLLSTTFFKTMSRDLARVDLYPIKQRKTTTLFSLSKKDPYDAAATDLPKENV